MSPPQDSSARRARALAVLAACVEQERQGAAHEATLSPAQALATIEAQLEEAELAREELAALQAAAEDSIACLARFKALHPLPLLTVDGQLQVIDLNHVARQLFRLDPTDTIPRPLLRRAVPGEAAARLLSALQDAPPEHARDIGPVTLELAASHRMHARVLLQRSSAEDTPRWTVLLVPQPPPSGDAALMERVLEATEDAVCVTSKAEEFVLVNRAFADMVGRPAPEVLGRRWTDILPLPEAVRHTAWDRQVLGSGLRLRQREQRAAPNDHTPREIASLKHPLHDAEGRPIGVMTHARDVTEEVANDAARRLSELVFQHASDAIAVTDVHLRLQRVNPAFERLVGFSAAQLAEVRMDRLGNVTEPLQRRELRADLEARGFWAGELPLRTAEGRDLVVWCSVARLADESGVPIGYVAVYTDLTALRAVHAENEKLAQFDPLTGLPNRATLLRRLEQAVASSERRGGSFSVAFIDVDHFKALNDTLGHAVGDSLLRLAAERLRSVLRPRDVVARIGGDEFVVLMPAVAADAAQTIMGRVRHRFLTPLELDTQRGYRCTLSIGIASYPEHARTAEELLRLADTAMYAAKSTGRNRTQVYEASMGAEVSRAFDIRNAVLRAIEDNELELYFQPLFRLETRAVVGAEALVRWNRPGHGLVPPDDFLPAMALAGMLTDLDRWVFREALAHANRWIAEGLVDREWILSINQTSISINQTDWVDALQRSLENAGFTHDPNAGFPIRLQLELTEDHLAEPVPTVLANLQRLREMGLSLAVDDFGTGYSNLSSLYTLPVSTLKIDRSFVRNLGNDPGAGVVIEAMILLSRKLGYETVAEGVETDAQADRLLALDCRLGQGYLVAPPIPADLFAERFLKPVRTAADAPPTPTPPRGD